jgi:hypothetical protein
MVDRETTAELPMGDEGSFGYEGGEEFNDEQLLSMFMDVEGLNSLQGTANPGQPAQVRTASNCVSWRGLNVPQS